MQLQEIKVRGIYLFLEFLGPLDDGRIHVSHNRVKIVYLLEDIYFELLFVYLSGVNHVFIVHDARGFHMLQYIIDIALEQVRDLLDEGRRFLYVLNRSDKHGLSIKEFIDTYLVNGECSDTR